MRRALAAAALAASCVLAPCIARAGESIVSVATRDGVSERYILETADDAPKTIVAISFIGGPGIIHLERRPRPLRFPKAMNALVRIRHALVNADIADVIVDAPSDRLDSGMDDAFRASAEHAADIGAVIADVKKRYPDARIYLVGTSRGTISAAHLGVALADRIAGVILTSTVTVRTRGGPGLSRFDFDALKLPTLFIHHADDGCPASPYTGVARLATKFPVVTAHGGEAPESGPCDPLAPHGFYGLDAPFVAAMQAFMYGKPYPRTLS